MSLPSHLPFAGHTAAPAQSWGRVRLIPILRPDCPPDLRLDDPFLVGPDREAIIATRKVSYDPGLLLPPRIPGDAADRVVHTTLDGDDRQPRLVLRAERQGRRRPDRALRMLPFDVAMNGFLSRWISGPDTTWPGWTGKVRRRGFAAPREHHVYGRSLPDLGEALRLFEALPDQVGVALLIDDTLANVSIFAHPGDYRILHSALIEDAFSSLFRTLGPGAGELPLLESPLTGQPTDLDALRDLVGEQRRALAAVAWTLTAPLWESPLEVELRYDRLGHRHVRFTSSTGPAPFVGEAILRPDGTLGYLKTYRLDRTAWRRFELLRCFAAHDWSPAGTAAALGLSLPELARRLDQLGFPDALTPTPSP